jgi:hypothetical protein
MATRKAISIIERGVHALNELEKRGGKFNPTFCKELRKPMCSVLPEEESVQEEPIPQTVPVEPIQETVQETVQEEPIPQDVPMEPIPQASQGQPDLKDDDWVTVNKEDVPEVVPEDVVPNVDVPKVVPKKPTILNALFGGRRN